MKKEFDLSEKIDDRGERLLVRDVKKFIQLLKESIDNGDIPSWVIEEINKLAGKDLI